MSISIEDIIQSAKNEGAIIKPATLEKIAETINSYRIDQLPKNYIEFLEKSGNGNENSFLVGSSCFLNELPFLKKWAEELLLENDFSKSLQDDNFVFWMSQGYQFAFFNLSEGNDPPVYYFREGTDQKDFVKITNSFTEFLYRMQKQDKNLFAINEAY